MKKDRYQQIAKAIEYLDENFKNQPSLDEVAKEIHLSPHHFQKLFVDWVGISPKKYLQYLSINYAKSLLKEKESSLFDTAIDTGLSGTGRLHDLFISIESMTPGEYKNGGENLSIAYSIKDSPFGPILMANTDKGLCWMAFFEDEKAALEELKENFHQATWISESTVFHDQALKIFNKDANMEQPIPLHIKGSSFQLKVWEALLSIPNGKLVSYKEIANQIEAPKASRAVGSAIGANPIAYLIPCHRVIQGGGGIGGYRWNPIRKKAMIAWEASKLHE